MRKLGRKPDQYDWNKEQKRSHKEWREKEMKRRQQEEMKDCTFKPQTQKYKGRAATPIEKGRKAYDRYMERIEKESVVTSSKSFLVQETEVTDMTTTTDRSASRVRRS